MVIKTRTGVRFSVEALSQRKRAKTMPLHDYDDNDNDDGDDTVETSVTNFLQQHSHVAAATAEVEALIQDPIGSRAAATAKREARSACSTSRFNQRFYANHLPMNEALNLP